MLLHGPESGYGVLASTGKLNRARARCRLSSFVNRRTRERHRNRGRLLQEMFVAHSCQRQAQPCRANCVRMQSRPPNRHWLARLVRRRPHSNREERIRVVICGGLVLGFEHHPVSGASKISFILAINIWMALEGNVPVIFWG